MKSMKCTVRAALIILLATDASAFVQYRPSPQRAAPLHATEAFHRSLLAARLGGGSATGAPAALDTDASPIDIDKEPEQEKFQRSLFEAKIKYDACSRAATPVPATVEVVAEPDPASVAIVEPELSVSDPKSEPNASEPIVAAAILELEPAQAAVAAPEPVPVPEPEPELEPEPEPTAPEPVVAAGIPEPKLESVPKPFIPEPTETPNPARDLKSTEFTVPKELAIVPLNEATVQFTAGTIGAAAGLILGGPVVAALGAASFNYLSRKDEDTSTTTSVKKVVDTASKAAIGAYNSVAQLEKDNHVLDTIFNLLEKVVDKAKELNSPAGDALAAVESTLGGIANKVEELNDDYDFVGGAGTVLESVGDLVEISVDKVVDLNDEYKLTERVGEVVKGAGK